MKAMNMTRKNIEIGDRLFARLTMGGNTVVEFMINSVGSMTDLLAELRRLAKGVRGLVKLYLRNQSRGWSMERPLMLYSSMPSSAPMRAGSPSSPFATSGQRMLFPWETH